jgi:hypothetical protein
LILFTEAYSHSVQLNVVVLSQSLSL